MRVKGVKWKALLKSRWKSGVGVRSNSCDVFTLTLVWATDYLSQDVGSILTHVFLQLKVAVPGLLTIVTLGLMVTYFLLDQTLGSLPAQKGAYHRKIFDALV